MNRHEKLIRVILEGESDANIRFADVRALMLYLGFDERVRGSHHIYRKSGIVTRLNFQVDNANAKPYQIRQLRQVVLEYGLGRND